MAASFQFSVQLPCLLLLRNIYVFLQHSSYQLSIYRMHSLLLPFLLLVYNFPQLLALLLRLFLLLLEFFLLRLLPKLLFFADDFFVVAAALAATVIIVLAAVVAVNIFDMAATDAAAHNASAVSVSLEVLVAFYLLQHECSNSVFSSQYFSQIRLREYKRKTHISSFFKKYRACKCGRDWRFGAHAMCRLCPKNFFINCGRCRHVCLFNRQAFER